MVQSVEQAIDDQLAAVKRNVDADADQLLHRLSADSDKHLTAMDDSIAALQVSATVAPPGEYR